MEWIIIGLLIFFAVRWVNMLMSLQNGENPNSARPRDLAGRQFPSWMDEQKFKEFLEGKSEEDLWKLRNEVHAEMVNTKDEALRDFYLSCIGLIDKKIYALRHS